jgi:hypothetical protein
MVKRERLPPEGEDFLSIPERDHKSWKNKPILEILQIKPLDC